MKSPKRFVVGTPSRSVCDLHATAAQRQGWLRLYAIGTRRLTKGIEPELTSRLPLFGLLAYAGARLLPTRYYEPYRFSLHPLYDRWLKSQLRREDFLLSSYGYANESFEWLKKHGGLTFLDAGNSHPQQFWDIMTEEHRVWGFDAPPVARHHFFRSMRMMESVDYIFSPSKYVTDSFLKRGFPAKRIFHLPYAVNFEHFSPPSFSRPSSRPLSVICTGAVSLRKGAPYLLEAMRLVRKKVRNSRLLLTRGISPGMESILSKYGDLEIDWSPHLPHEGLSKRLWEGDIFALPSLEEGMGRTVQEAMACGLPVILTPNCGAVDFVKEGLNGSVIPIRNPEALASAILYWWDRIQDRSVDPDTAFKDRLSFESFSSTFEHQMNPLISGI